MRSPALRYARANSGLTFRPDASCVLWLPGQDDAYSSTIRDRSGKGNNGTITNATWARTGQGLWYQNFDGDDHVDCGIDSSLSITTNLLVEFWVRLNDDATGVRAGFIGKSGDNEGAGWVITQDAPAANIVRLFYVDAGGLATFDLVNLASRSIWYHLGLTFDGSDFYSYVYGVQENTKNDVTTFTTTTNSLQIGRNSGRTTRYVKADMGLSRVSNPTTMPRASYFNANYNQERHLFGV